MFIERITNIDCTRKKGLKKGLNISCSHRKEPAHNCRGLPPPSFWWRCGYWTTAMLKVLLSLRERPLLLPHGLRSLADGCTALTELQAGLGRRRGSALSSLAELDAASRYARRGVGTRTVNTPAASFLPTYTRFISSPQLKRSLLKMAQCSGSENVSSTVNEAPKKRKVAIITGITGQVTRPASYYS